MEYCYFTPEPEAGLLGGRLDVPTLNIIGTKDAGLPVGRPDEPGRVSSLASEFQHEHPSTKSGNDNSFSFWDVSLKWRVLTQNPRQHEQC